MKKIGVIAVLFVLLVSSLVYAQQGRIAGYTGDLTEEQQEELAPIYASMEEHRAQMRETMQAYRMQIMEALAEMGVISEARLEWLVLGQELAAEEGWQPKTHHGRWGTELPMHRGARGRR